MEQRCGTAAAAQPVELLSDPCSPRKGRRRSNRCERRGSKSKRCQTGMLPPPRPGRNRYPKFHGFRFAPPVATFRGPIRGQRLIPIEKRNGASKENPRPLLAPTDWYPYEKTGSLFWGRSSNDPRSFPRSHCSPSAGAFRAPAASFSNSFTCQARLPSMYGSNAVSRFPQSAFRIGSECVWRPE